MKKTFILLGLWLIFLQILKLPDGTIKVLVEGWNEVTSLNLVQTESFLLWKCRNNQDDYPEGLRLEALLRSLNVSI